MDPISSSNWYAILPEIIKLLPRIWSGQKQIDLQRRLGIPPIPPPIFNTAQNQLQQILQTPEPPIGVPTENLEQLAQKQIFNQLAKSVSPSLLKTKEGLTDLGPNVDEQALQDQMLKDLQKSALPDLDKIKEFLDPIVAEAAAQLAAQQVDITSSGEDYQNSFLGALFAGQKPGAFSGSLLSNIGAGALGLLGNIIQSQMELGRLKSGIAEVAPSMQEQFTKWFEMLKPYILSNRVGQFGDEARIGAQRAMNLPRLTPSDVAAAQALSQQAQQVGELGSLLGSRAIQESGRQIGALKQALRDSAMGGDVAALSGALRQFGQNLRSAMAEQALEKAMQGAQAAASMRAQIPQLLNQARQTTFATQVEPYLTQTNLMPLNTAAGMAGQIINTGQDTVLLPANPLKPAGDLWAGSSSSTMGQNFINTNLQKGKIEGSEPYGRAAWFQKLFKG